MRFAKKLLACGFLAASSCPAYAQCAATPEPEVTVISRQVNLTWDFTQSGFELTTMLNDGRTSPTLGMTTIQMGYSHDIHLPNGACKMPSVHVILSARMATVAIARELSPEDCYFRAAVEHEKKHAESAQRAVDDASVALNAKLATALKAASAAAAGADKRSAYTVYNEIVEKEAQAAILTGTEQFGREGTVIDSEEESARFNLACGPRTLLAARQASSPSVRWKR